MNPHSLHAMPMLLRVMAQLHTAGHLHPSPDRTHLVLPGALEHGAGQDIPARVQRVGRRHIALLPHGTAARHDGVLLGHIQGGDAHFCPRPFKAPATRLTEPVVASSLRSQGPIHIGPARIPPEASHDPTRVYPFWTLPVHRTYTDQPWIEPLQDLALGTATLLHARHTAHAAAASTGTVRFIFSPPPLTAILDPQAWPAFSVAYACNTCLRANPLSEIFNTTAKALAQAHGATLEQFLDLSRRSHTLVIPALALDHHSAHTRVRAHQVAAPVRAWAAAHGLDG